MDAAGISVTFAKLEAPGLETLSQCLNPQGSFSFSST